MGKRERLETQTDAGTVTTSSQASRGCGFKYQACLPVLYVSMVGWVVLSSLFRSVLPIYCESSWWTHSLLQLILHFSLLRAQGTRSAIPLYDILVNAACFFVTPSTLVSKLYT